ncbi:MAG: diaminopimelate epimerase [Pseudomonadales bacterium]
MLLPFSKMHGLGNDFMLLDLVTQHFEPVPEQIRAWSDRHTGVGFDSLLVIEPPTDPHADFRYRIFNADGTEVEQCGNGARCAALFVAARALSPKRSLILQTMRGRVCTTRLNDDQVEVDMGAPELAPQSLPFDDTVPGVSAIIDRPGQWQIQTNAGTVELFLVSMGNPHAVLFVDNAAHAAVDAVGNALMQHAAFPAGVNVGFCQVVDDAFLRLRVFERGIGETQACGSGACAAAVAARLSGRGGPRLKISLPGGKVRVTWQGPDSPVKLVGPATLVFEGQIEA